MSMIISWKKESFFSCPILFSQEGFSGRQPTPRACYHSRRFSGFAHRTRLLLSCGNNIQLKGKRPVSFVVKSHVVVFTRVLRKKTYNPLSYFRQSNYMTKFNWYSLILMILLYRFSKYERMDLVNTERRWHKYDNLRIKFRIWHDH